MAGCSGGEKAADHAQNATTAKNGAASEEGGHADEEVEIDLSADQIRKAGVELVRVIRSGGGALTLPATIEGDPQGMQVVSAAICGRVVSLTRNLGHSVGRLPTLALTHIPDATSVYTLTTTPPARH